MVDRYNTEKKGTYKRLYGEVQIQGDYSITRDIIEMLTSKGFDIINEPILQRDLPSIEKLKIYKAN